MTRKCVFWLLGFVVAAASALMMIGCARAGGDDDLRIQIDDIYWLLENIDTSYWTTGFDEATQLAMFSIVYSGDDITAADIKSARLSCQSIPDRWWSFSLDPGNIDTGERVIGTVNNRFYTTLASSNGSVFPVGPTTFEVTLNNGTKVTHVFDIPPPASTIWTDERFVYNEDYRGLVLDGYVPMVRRAVVGSHDKSGDTISINFTSSDPALFSGFVCFFDADSAYVGQSDYFRAYGSGDNPSFVNSGSGLLNNGCINALSIQTGNVAYQTGRSFTDIAKFRIVLTDGVQYLGTSKTCDCRSIGALFPF